MRGLRVANVMSRSDRGGSRTSLQRETASKGSPNGGRSPSVSVPVRWTLNRRSGRVIRLQAVDSRQSHRASSPLRPRSVCVGAVRLGRGLPARESWAGSPLGCTRRADCPGRSTRRPGRFLAANCSPGQLCVTPAPLFLTPPGESSPDMNRNDGKIVVVTGASSGIGEACASPHVNSTSW